MFKKKKTTTVVVAHEHRGKSGSAAEPRFRTVKARSVARIQKTYIIIKSRPEISKNSEGPTRLFRLEGNRIMLDVFIAIIGGGILLVSWLGELSKSDKARKRIKAYNKADEAFRANYTDKNLDSMVLDRLSKDKEGVLAELDDDIKEIYGDHKLGDKGFWYEKNSLKKTVYLGALLLSKQGKFFSWGLSGFEIGAMCLTGVRDIAFCKKIESNLRRAGVNVKFYVRPNEYSGKYDYDNLDFKKIYPEYYIDGFCPGIDKGKCRLW